MAKKILIISPNPTHPPFSGNSKCILSYSEMLLELGYDVKFLWIADYVYSREEEELTREFWNGRLLIFKQNILHRIMKAFFRYTRFNRTGYYGVDDFHPYGIKRFLNRIQKNESFDSVIINYIYLSKIFKNVINAKKLIYTHDVFTNRFQLTGNPWFSVTANEEAKALNRSDIVLAIQENEAVFYSYLTTRKVLSAYTHFTISVTPYSGNKVLLFLAGKNTLNLEAINYFIESVFSSLLIIHPELKLLIGGSICKLINNKLLNNSIRLYGEVLDLNDFYSQGDIFINPTYAGTGLKIKTFEAMAYGKVLISHPHNTTGIYKKESAPILVAENVAEYINHINMLFGNPDKIIQLKNESIKYIIELNSIVKSRFIEAIEQ